MRRRLKVLKEKGNTRDVIAIENTVWQSSLDQSTQSSVKSSAWAINTIKSADSSNSDESVLKFIDRIQFSGLRIINIHVRSEYSYPKKHNHLLEARNRICETCFSTEGDHPKHFQYVASRYFLSFRKQQGPRTVLKRIGQNGYNQWYTSRQGSGTDSCY